VIALNSDESYVREVASSAADRSQDYVAAAPKQIGFRELGYLPLRRRRE
jgi:hypothetical protein